MLCARRGIRSLLTSNWLDLITVDVSEACSREQIVEQPVLCGGDAPALFRVWDLWMKWLWRSHLDARIVWWDQPEGTTGSRNVATPLENTIRFPPFIFYPVMSCTPSLRFRVWGGRWGGAVNKLRDGLRLSSTFLGLICLPPLHILEADISDSKWNFCHPLNIDLCLERSVFWIIICFYLKILVV